MTVDSSQKERKLKATRIAILAAASLWVSIIAAGAQDTSKTKPKNEVTKVEHARKKDHTTKQVTPDPKKSPGKHADNLSKNVNHEANRESKNINKMFHKKKKA